MPIYYQNIRSLPAKKNIYTALSSTMYEILCFTETWLTNDHKIEQYIPSTFSSYTSNRSDTNSSFTRGGGVAILVRNGLKSQRVLQFEDNTIESVCVQIHMNSNQFIILYVAYIPPYSDNDVFNKHVNCIRNILSNVSCNLVVLGDFNLSKVKWEMCDEGGYFLPFDIPANKRVIYDNFLNRMMLLSLHQVCAVRNDCDNVLDLVFTIDYARITISSPQIAVTEVDKIDKAHPPIEVVYDCSIPRNSQVTKEIYVYKNGNYGRICRQLDAINFQHEFTIRDSSEAFDFLRETLHACIENNVPKKTIKCNSNPKWWNREMLHLKNKRNKAWKNKHVNEEEYFTALRNFNVMNEQLFNDYLTSIQHKIRDDPKYFWSYVKERNGNGSIPDVMSLNGCVADNTPDIVNLFADSFENMFEIDDTDIDFQLLSNSASGEKFEVRVSLDSIQGAIRRIKANGSVGPDDIHPKVIHECADSLIWPIWLLFTKTFDNGEIPVEAKLSRIIPIHKKNDKSNIANYRMIAIGSVLLRIMEKAVFVAMSTHVESKLCNQQHGFRWGRSVSTNLLNLSIATNEAFASRSQLDVFYGDFQTAFDRVCHRLLIQKLFKFGIGEKTVRWISSFIRERCNYVDIGGFRSRNFTSFSGVGAGTTLGPMLFLIFINDIHQSIRYSEFLLFADDIKVFVEVRTQSDTLKLQRDIDNIFKWCQDNRLHFNIGKCNIISLHRTNASIVNNYILNGQVIARVDEVRDLGVTIDSRFRFVPHIQKIISAARQTIGFIKRISSGRFDRSVLRLLFTAYVRSKLEFGAVIWDPYQQIYRDELESVQKGFLIYLLGDEHRTQFRLAPYHERGKLVDLPSLSSRRLEMKIMMGHDILSGLIKDPGLGSRFVLHRPNRQLRSSRFLSETVYSSDYLHWQPLAWITRLMNQYADLFLNSNAKTDFRVAIRRSLYFSDEDENQQNNT